MSEDAEKPFSCRIFIAISSLVPVSRMTIGTSSGLCLVAVTIPFATSSVRVIPTGGDWVRPEVARRLRTEAPGLRFAGLGGATETPVHNTIFEVADPYTLPSDFARRELAKSGVVVLSSLTHAGVALKRLVEYAKFRLAVEADVVALPSRDLSAHLKAPTLSEADSKVLLREAGIALADEVLVKKRDGLDAW